MPGLEGLTAEVMHVCAYERLFALCSVAKLVVRCVQSAIPRRYCEAGLQNLCDLKNKDRAVASVLQSVADLGCIDVHLVLVSKHETGTAEGAPGHWYMDDVNDIQYTARHWMRLDGTSPGYHDVFMEADEILQARDLTSMQ